MSEEIYTKQDLIKMFRLIVDANAHLQDWIDSNGAPSTLLKYASDLDHVIRNFGEQDKCACSHCSELVNHDEYTYPYCSRCYANVDGKCD